MGGTETMSSGLGASLLEEDDDDGTPPPPPRPSSALKGDATKAAIRLQAYWRWHNRTTRSSPTSAPPFPTYSNRVV